MKILCIENDPRILDLTVRRCRDLPQNPEVFGFCGEKEALAWLRQNGAASGRAAAAENGAGRRASARTFGEFDLFADGEAAREALEDVRWLPADSAVVRKLRTML